MPSWWLFPGPAICRIWIVRMPTANSAGNFSRVTARAIRPEGAPMPKVLVLYYSSYGHIEAMAYAQAEGIARVPKTQVIVKRVAELCPLEVARASGFKL